MNIPTKPDRKLILVKLAISLPVFLFFIPNQKPQLIGTAAILASVLIVLESEELSKRKLFLALGSLFFALSIKYSFYLIGSVVLIFIWFKAYSSNQLRIAVFLSLGFYLFLLLPTHLNNFMHYGDPISPFLTFALNSSECKYVFNFAEHLRSYSEGFGFPLGLVFPKSFGTLSKIVGLGLFSVFFIKGLNHRTKFLVCISIVGFTVIILAGQLTSRFFLEIYFFLVAALGFCPQFRRGIRFFSLALTCQLLGVLLSLFVGAGNMIPGMFSFEKRERGL